MNIQPSSAAATAHMNAGIADDGANDGPARTGPSRARSRMPDAFGPTQRQSPPLPTAAQARRPAGTPPPSLARPQTPQPQPPTMRGYDPDLHLVLLIDQIQRAVSLDHVETRALVDGAMLAPAHTVEILQTLAENFEKVPLVEREAAFQALNDAFRQLPSQEGNALRDALQHAARARHAVPEIYANAELAVIDGTLTAAEAAVHYRITDSAQLARLAAVASTAETNRALQIAEAGAVQLLAVAVPLVSSLFADVAVHATEDNIAAIARAHAQAMVARDAASDAHPSTALETWQAALANVQRAQADAPETILDALDALKTASGMLFAPELYMPLPSDDAARHAAADYASSES